MLQPLSSDALAPYVAALACHLSADCRDAGAVERLTALAPDDAVHWILALADASDAQITPPLLRHTVDAVPLPMRSDCRRILRSTANGKRDCAP